MPYLERSVLAIEGAFIISLAAIAID